MERLMSDGYPFIFQLFLMTSSSILEEMSKHPTPILAV